jgi:hypothetical protein
MMMSSEVWVLEPTDYDQYGILGVYDTAEAAKAGMPHLGWDWEDGEWLARAPEHYRIYTEQIKTLASIRAKREAEEQAAAVQGNREEMRLAVRVPLPYEEAGRMSEPLEFSGEVDASEKR